MPCQLQLVKLGSVLGLCITESLFGYKTIIQLPYSLRSSPFLHPYLNSQVIGIRWDGTQLQSFPPQYRIILVFPDGYQLKITVSELQFQLLSKACLIKKIRYGSY